MDERVLSLLERMLYVMDSIAGEVESLEARVSEHDFPSEVLRSERREISSMQEELEKLKDS